MDNLSNDGTVKKDTIFGQGGDYWLGQLERGANDKIYFTLIENSTWDSELVESRNGYLHVINNPNEIGLAADVQLGDISLEGQRALHGLPNQLNYSLGALAGSPCDTITSSVGIQESVMPSVKVYPNPTTGIINIESIGSGEFALYHLDGRRVFTKDIKAGKNQVELDANLSGHYLGLVTSSGRVVYSEILIIE